MVDGFSSLLSPGEGSCYCLSLYDWDGAVSASWLNLAEEIFALLSSAPADAVANLKSRNTHGAYLKSRIKIQSFLDLANSEGEFDVRIRSEIKYSNDDAFPSDVEFAFSGNSVRRNRLSVAVRSGDGLSFDDLVSAVLPAVVRHCGPAYGGAFAFPAALGPSYYLSSIAYRLPERSWADHQAYAERLARWRDRSARNAFSPKAGYFREIYTTNFITDAHLKATLQGKGLEKYAARVGLLRSLPECRGMVRWDIGTERIREVQALMETSGLVLSAPIEPRLS